MARYFYIDAEGKQKGTFSAEELKKENTHKETLVWTQGWQKWMPICEVPELQNICYAASFPPAPPAILPETKSSSQVVYQPVFSHPIQSTPSNGVGVTGFVLAVISIFLWWLPFLGWLIWFLGLIFSFAGIFRKPRGLAIAGLCISLIGIVFLLFLGALIFTAAGLDSLA